MTVEKREAIDYDEFEVMERISAGGPNVIRAHLAHLEQHKQDAYLAQAHAYLEEHDIAVPGAADAAEAPVAAAAEAPENTQPPTAPQIPVAAAIHAQHGGSHGGGGCPGSRARSIGPSMPETNTTPKPDSNTAPTNTTTGSGAPSELRQWPIQLHLVPPQAPYFQGADVLLAADCSAFAVGAFHQDFLRGKALAIACPKLDQGQEAYIAKLVSLIDDARINTLTVMIMEVPCCGGLIRMAQQACAAAQRKVPVKQVVLSLEGKIIQEDWVVV